MGAAVVLLVLFVLGMTVWGLQDSLSVHILVLDALVNAIAMPVASLASATLLVSGLRTAVHSDAAV